MKKLFLLIGLLISISVFPQKIFYNDAPTKTRATVAFDDLNHGIYKIGVNMYWTIGGDSILRILPTGLGVIGNLTSTTYGAALVTDTELGYLDGVTSNIQTQLNAISPTYGLLSTRITNDSTNLSNNYTPTSGLSISNWNTAYGWGDWSSSVSAKWSNDGTSTATGNWDIGANSFASSSITIDAGNGNQFIMDNAGEQYTQMTFKHDGVTKVSNYWDNTNSLYEFLVLGSTMLSTSSTALTVGGDFSATGTTINFTTSGTILTVGVGADNGTVSAGVFTDRTKHFDGDALEEIKKIKGKNGEIDHYSLPSFARTFITRVDTLGVETIEEGRDLGAMISVLTKGIQQLIDQNDSLSRRVYILEKKNK